MFRNKYLDYAELTRQLADWQRAGYVEADTSVVEPQSELEWLDDGPSRLRYARAARIDRALGKRAAAS